MAAPLIQTPQSMTLSATTTALLDTAVATQIATLNQNLASGPSAGGTQTVVVGTIRVIPGPIASISTTGVIAMAYATVQWAQMQ